MLELAILGLLKEQELHGYELKKRLTETLGQLSGVSFGSLYPALSRLEAAGAVKAVEARPPAAAPIPVTGSLTGELAAVRAFSPAGRARLTPGRSGRGKKVYGITDVGERLFEELLAADLGSNDDDRVFNCKLAFARYLPADARLGLLERRRAQLVERLARARASLRGWAERASTDSYTRSLMEHGTEATEREISWLDRLIADEHTADRRTADRPTADRHATTSPTHPQEGMTP